MTEQPMRAVKKVIVAETAEGFERIHAILDEAVALAHVTTFNEAVEMMSWMPDMVICGIDFDDSRMFDLLRIAMANGDFKGKPFLCYRDLDSALSDTLLQSLEIACRTLGPARFVDLYSLKAMHGAHRAHAIFRETIFACLC